MSPERQTSVLIWGLWSEYMHMVVPPHTSVNILKCWLALWACYADAVCGCVHVGMWEIHSLYSYHHRSHYGFFFFCDHFLQIENLKGLFNPDLYDSVGAPLAPSYNVTSSSHYNILDPDIHVDATSHKPPTQTLTQMKHTIQGTDTPRWHKFAEEHCMISQWF